MTRLTLPFFYIYSLWQIFNIQKPHSTRCISNFSKNIFNIKSTFIELSPQNYFCARSLNRVWPYIKDWFGLTESDVTVQCNVPLDAIIWCRFTAGSLPESEVTAQHKVARDANNQSCLTAKIMVMLVGDRSCKN